MGTASIAYVLWTKHMRFDPTDPAWPNRDRFILSAGHGSMLLYAMLHLSGYDLSIEELKNFRQWGSKTPGHPEYGDTPGVETTTGPLGQGFATGVGMAIAADHLASIYNQDDFSIIDPRIYAIVSDGDLMEGVASEAASLAGHLQLGRLIYLYDDNRISIDGSTELAFTEDRAARFQAYGWQVLHVDDGNDVKAIDEAIRKAQNDDRPSLIICRTQIGYGLPTKQGTAAAHGEPPGEEELAAAKEALGWPQEPSFMVADDVREHFAVAANKGKAQHEGWLKALATYRDEHPELAGEFVRVLERELPGTYESALPIFPPDEKGMASRAASGKVLNALADAIPELVGGSADLTGSNKTALNNASPFNASDRSGRYFHFGVREHAMGAILNGMALFGGLIPFGGTFLVFSDYMRPAIRLAALMGLRVIYVFSHDSIGLGEDGPTHQPIEQLAALRTIPNLVVLRPADANETSQAWKAAIEGKNNPTALALSRQALPTLDRNIYADAGSTLKGAYVLLDPSQERPDIILMASGSEVDLIIQAGEFLTKEGIAVRLVSFPSWELFEEQPIEYQEQVLPPSVKPRIAVEAGSPIGWKRWVGDHGVVLGLDHFGASAPYQELYQQFGLTPERIIEVAHLLLNTKSE